MPLLLLVGESVEYWDVLLLDNSTPFQKTSEIVRHIYTQQSLLEVSRNNGWFSK